MIKLFVDTFNTINPPFPIHPSYRKKKMLFYTLIAMVAFSVVQGTFLHQVWY